MLHNSFKTECTNSSKTFNLFWKKKRQFEKNEFRTLYVRKWLLNLDIYHNIQTIHLPP